MVICCRYHIGGLHETGLSTDRTRFRRPLWFNLVRKLQGKSHGESACFLRIG